MKKKYHIAITGTFDVENYGDLMFPVVFEKAMRKRGLNFDLFLFSPSRTAKKALDNRTTVYSFQEFEELHKKHHFDALIVGGGAIIHFNSIRVKLPNGDKYEEYRNIDSWYTIACLAAKNNVKIIFNVPQAPFEFSKSVTPLARSVFLTADYLSVRDEFSKKNILRTFQKNKTKDVLVYPDSVCSIACYYNKKELTTKAKKLVGFDGKYVVIHFSRVMPEEVEPVLVKAIERLRRDGYRIVFLPLGYTHGDDVAMRALKRKYRLDCITFKNKLSIDDMTAILAGCEIYIGTSFHGSIVSIAFGGRALSFNYYEPTLKNVDNYRQFGISDYLVKNYSELLGKLDGLLKCPASFKPSIEYNLARVEEHFDKMHSKIVDGGGCMIGGYSTVQNELLDAIARLPEYDEERLRDVATINSLKKDNDGLMMENERINKEIEYYQNELDEYKKNYDLLINSKTWRMTEPIRKMKDKIGSKWRK